MKVLLLCNYDLGAVRDSWEAEGREAPAQHLWGYAGLAAHGVEVDILPYHGSGLLKTIGNKLKVLGDLDQQIRAFWRHRSYDAVYSAHHPTTGLLAFLRLIGLMRRPLVAVGYQAPRKTGAVWRLLTTLFVRGNDRLLCMSEAMERDLAALGMPQAKMAQIRWGVELRHYAASEGEQTPPYLISPGKTYRDFRTLCAGLPQEGCRLVICGAGRVAQEALGGGHPKVELVETMLSWPDYLALIGGARAMVIPLDIERNLLKNAVGLTAVTEALALGKPLLMTRNAYIGIDIEAEGAGFWIDPGDATGWADAIARIDVDPDLARRMGHRARKLAEDRVNLTAFTETLAQHLHAVAKP